MILGIIISALIFVFAIRLTLWLYYQEKYIFGTLILILAVMFGMKFFIKYDKIYREKIVPRIEHYQEELEISTSFCSYQY